MAGQLKKSNTALAGPSRSSRKLLELRSTVRIAGILLLNNCYVGAIMQCLFNNPKMTIFDQLTAGHPSHCDIACCMSGKLINQLSCALCCFSYA